MLDHDADTINARLLNVITELIKDLGEIYDAYDQLAYDIYATEQDRLLEREIA